MRSGCALLAAAMLALAAPNVRAEDFCSTCEVQLGLGGTYHWVGWSHGIVAPIIFTFDHDRWELGAFRFTKGQDFYDSTFGVDIHFADPYWGFSFARRLELFPQKHWAFFAAAGASYKTEQDRLSSSWWNFNEEVGLQDQADAQLDHRAGGTALVECRYQTTQPRAGLCYPDVQRLPGVVRTCCNE